MLWSQAGPGRFVFSKRVVAPPGPKNLAAPPSYTSQPTSTASPESPAPMPHGRAYAPSPVRGVPYTPRTGGGNVPYGAFPPETDRVARPAQAVPSPRFPAFGTAPASARFRTTKCAV